MSLEQLARRLGEHGRNGDSLLLHVNPQELATMEALFGPVTVNPVTGLPEAFSWTKLLGGIGAGLLTAFTGGAAAPILAPLFAATGLATAIADKGKPKDTRSEAAKYLDERTKERVRDAQKNIPVTYLQSIAQPPNILGKENPIYPPNVRRMGTGFGEEEIPGYAAGGRISEDQARDTVLAILSRLEPQQPMAHGRMVNGGGAGLDDFIPARLSDGEYVMPADVVSMIGDGSSAAGGRRLDKMIAGVRKQKTGTHEQAGKLRMGTMMGGKR